MRLDIIENYKADIIDENKERLELNSQEYADLVKTIEEVVHDNHGIDFYKGLIESIELLKITNDDVDVYEIIVELEQKIVNNAKNNPRLKGSLEGIILNLDNYSEEIHDNPINKFIRNDYEKTVDLYIAKKENIKKNGYKKVSWNKKKPFNDYAILQVGEEEIRISSNLYESINHILDQLNDDYKEDNNQLIIEMVADFERTYYKTDGLTLAEQERNLTDAIEDGKFIKKPEYDYYYKFFIDLLEKTPYFVQEKMEKYLEKAVEEDKIYQYYPLKDITTGLNVGFEVIMTKEDSAGEDNVVKTPEELIDLAINSSLEEVYEKPEGYIIEGTDYESRYNVLEYGELLSVDSPYELLDTLLDNNRMSLILSEYNDKEFEKYFATRNKELLNNFTDDVIDKYKIMEKLNFKNGFNLQLEIIERIKNNPDFTLEDVQEIYGLTTNQIIENTNDIEEISNIIYVTTNEQTDEWLLNYDDSYYDVHKVVKQSLEDQAITNNVDKKYLSKLGIINLYLKGIYRIGEDLLIEDVYNQIDKDFLKKELIQSGETGEVWDEIEKTVLDILLKEEDIILNEVEYDKWINNRAELNKFSEKIQKKLWNEINDEIYQKIDTYMKNTTPNKYFNPTMEGYIEFSKYYPVELISSRLEHWFLKNTGRTLNEFDNIQADEILIPELYMNENEIDKEYIEIKPISINEYENFVENQLISNGLKKELSHDEGITLRAKKTSEKWIELLVIYPKIHLKNSLNIDEVQLKEVENYYKKIISDIKKNKNIIIDSEHTKNRGFSYFYKLQFEDTKNLDIEIDSEALNVSEKDKIETTKLILEEFGLNNIKKYMNDSGYIQNYRSEGPNEPSSNLLDTFNSDVIEDYISVSKIINTRDNKLVPELFNYIEEQETTNGIDSNVFIEDFKEETGYEIQFHELEEIVKNSKEVFWSVGEDILFTTSKLIHYKLIDDYLTNNEEFNYQKTLEEVNDYYGAWHIDELNEKKGEKIEEYLETTIEDIYTPKFIYNRQFDEASSKFNAGNILVEEYKTLKSEKRVDSILENYNNDIFDGSKFGNVSGISETNDEIIIKRDSGNPFNWEMKVIEKNLLKEKLRLIYLPIEYSENNPKEIIETTFNFENYNTIWNYKKEMFNKGIVSKSELLLINDNNEVVDFYQGDKSNFEEKPSFEDWKINKNYYDSTTTIGKLLQEKSEIYFTELIVERIRKFEDVIHDEKLVQQVANEINYDKYIFLLNNDEDIWMLVEDELFDYLEKEGKDDFIKFESDEIEHRFYNYLSNSEELNNFISKVHINLNNNELEKAIYKFKEPFTNDNLFEEVYSRIDKIEYIKSAKINDDSFLYSEEVLFDFLRKEKNFDISEFKEKNPEAYEELYKRNIYNKLVDPILVKIDKKIKEDNDSEQIGKNLQEIAIKNIDKLAKINEYLPQYSTKNKLFILGQTGGNATIVKPFKAWNNELDENGKKIKIKSGQKALSLFVPNTIKFFINENDEYKLLKYATQREKKEIEEGNIEVQTKTKITPSGKVFDISQTTASKSYSEKLISKNISEDSMVIFKAIQDYSNELGINIEASNSLVKAKGLARVRGIDQDKKILIDPKYEENELITTLIHELVHHKLHFKDSELNNNIKEIEAETTAYLVATRYGIESEESKSYIQHFMNKVDFKENEFEKMIDNCLNTSDEIFEQIEKNIKEDIKMNDKLKIKVEINKRVFNDENKLIDSIEFEKVKISSNLWYAHNDVYLMEDIDNDLCIGSKGDTIARNHDSLDTPIRLNNIYDVPEFYEVMNKWENNEVQFDNIKDMSEQTGFSVEDLEEIFDNEQVNDNYLIEWGDQKKSNVHNTQQEKILSKVNENLLNKNSKKYSYSTAKEMTNNNLNEVKNIVIEYNDNEEVYEVKNQLNNEVYNTYSEREIINKLYENKIQFEDNNLNSENTKKDNKMEM